MLHILHDESQDWRITLLLQTERARDITNIVWTTCSRYIMQMQPVLISRVVSKWQTSKQNLSKGEMGAYFLRAVYCT